MTIDDKTRDEKVQYDINREAAKMPALSSDKIHKYDYHTGEDILPSNKQQIIEQAKFTYSPLGKAIEKQIKTIEDQGEKQVKALNMLKFDNNKLTIEDVIPKSVFANDEAKEEFNKIKEIEKNVEREKLFYKSNKNKYNFKNFQIIKTFGKDIYNGKINFEKADEYQSNLVEKINNFIKKTKPKNEEKRREEENLEKTCTIFILVEKWFLMVLKVKYF